MPSPSRSLFGSVHAVKGHGVLGATSGNGRPGVSHPLIHDLQILPRPNLGGDELEDEGGTVDGVEPDGQISMPVGWRGDGGADGV